MADAHAAETPLTVNDAVWERLMALTDGAVAVCYQCGTCTASCPWGVVREGGLSVRALVRAAQLGIATSAPELWLCTTCGQCEAACPREVPVAEVLLALRYLAWERRQTPKGLPSVLWSLYWNGNPLFQPPSHRSLWAADLDLPLFDPAQHEILLHVGCAGAYDRRAGRVARAVVTLLRAAGVPFGVLGDDEPCCGETALSLGHEAYFDEIAEMATQTFRDHGVKQLVTISPHCYDALKRGEEEAVVLHITDLLANLVQDGRLTFEQTLPRRVTFHDPCYQARRYDACAAPRELLLSIPGLQLMEMAHNRGDTVCCGGGGGRMWLETDPGERFADLRVAEAVGTGAEWLVTTCPFCVSCLEDSVKGQQLTELRVLDVAEVAAMALR